MGTLDRLALLLPEAQRLAAWKSFCPLLSENDRHIQRLVVDMLGRLVPLLHKSKRLEAWQYAWDILQNFDLYPYLNKKMALHFINQLHQTQPEAFVSFFTYSLQKDNIRKAVHLLMTTQAQLSAPDNNTLGLLIDQQFFYIPATASQMQVFKEAARTRQPSHYSDLMRTLQKTLRNFISLNSTNIINFDPPPEQLQNQFKLVSFPSTLSSPKELTMYSQLSNSATNNNDNSQVSAQSEPTTVQPESPASSNTLVKFYLNGRQVYARLMEQPQLQAMAQRPRDFGLAENGLSHWLIQAKLAATSEKTLLTEIQNRFSTLNISLKEHDTQYQNFALHWCAVLNYPRLAEYLIKKGYKLEVQNQLGLNPLQTAIMMGHDDFVLARFNKQPQFSEILLRCTNLEGQSIDLKLNELHLAIMCRNIDLVKAIFQCFAQKKVPINTEIPGVGNLLHLIAYVALSDKQAPELSHTSDAITLLQLLMQQFSAKALTKLLTEKSTNYEGCTPLMLAAKHGLVGLIQALITFMKLHTKQTQGLAEIEQAFYIAAQHGEIEAMEAFWYNGFEHSHKHKAYHPTIFDLKEKKTHDERYERTLNVLENWSSEAYFSQYEQPEPASQPYENIVFQGGGGKGFAFPYVVMALEAYCQRRSEQAVNPLEQAQLTLQNVKRVVGTSAGAIFALGSAIGFTTTELEQMLDYDFSTFLESERLQAVVTEMQSTQPSLEKALDQTLNELGLELERIKKIYQVYQSSQNHPWLAAAWEAGTHGASLFKQCTQAIERIKALNQRFQGFSSGQKAYEFLQGILQAKQLPADLTFGELAQKVKAHPTQFKHLHIVVTNLSRGEFEVLSTENPLYKHYLVLDAVRASMSYPLVFVPHHLRIKENGHIKTLQDEYIDGGVLRNYAIDEFDFKKYSHNDWPGDPRFPELNKATIGFRFTVQEQTARNDLAQTDNHASTLLSRVKAFLSLYLEAEEIIGRYMDKAYHRSIEIDTGYISTFTFKQLNPNDKQWLQARSEEAVAQYFTGKKPVVSAEPIFPKKTSDTNMASNLTRNSSIFSNSDHVNVNNNQSATQPNYQGEYRPNFQ